jgi:hypothetical protein
VLQILTVFVALAVQHEKRMRYTVICGISGSVFFQLSHKRHNFREKLLNIKCVSNFSTNSD